MSIVPNRRMFIRTQPQQSSGRAHSLLRAGIRDGLIGRGEQLVEDRLIHSLATSRNSVRKALQLLVNERIVTRQAHHGTRSVGRIRRVSLDKPNLRAVTDETGPEHVEWEELERQVIPAPTIVAAMLGLGEGSRVLVTEHLLTLNGAPYGLRIAYRPVDEHEIEVAQTTPASARQEICALYSTIERVDATIEAIAAEPRTSRLLGVEPGDPLLVHQLVMYSAGDVARELSFVNYHSSRVALSSTGMVDAWSI